MLGSAGPLVLGPVSPERRSYESLSPESWVLGPVSGSNMQVGVFCPASRSKWRSRVPGIPLETVCILLWSIMISPSSLCLCSGLPSLWLRQHVGLSDGNIDWDPMAMFRCPISNVHVHVPVLALVPAPAPCPHPRSIIGHVAGWLDPPVFPTVSHRSRTDSTAGTGVELLEAALRAGLLDQSSIRPVTHSLAHSLLQSVTHSFTHSGPGGQGFDARCLSH